MKPYIDENVKCRGQTKIKFQQDFYKFNINSVFGKTCENVRDRCKYELLTSSKRFNKLSNKSLVKKINIICDTMVGVHKKSTDMLLNKPRFIGAAILDLSKELMYDFHYNTMLKKYGKDKIKLLFTDTDSLCYHIQTEDIYEDLKDCTDQFDYSGYPSDHHLYSNTNNKVCGKFKDEACAKQIVEFVGLKSKIYSYRMDDEYECKKLKGISTRTVKNDISFQDYKDCLFNSEIRHNKMNTIRSKNHNISSLEINKISLSCFDDKSYRSSVFETLSHGHYKINLTL
jgi:hypothetical protein